MCHRSKKWSMTGFRSSLHLLGHSFLIHFAIVWWRSEMNDLIIIPVPSYSAVWRQFKTFLSTNISITFIFYSAFEKQSSIAPARKKYFCSYFDQFLVIFGKKGRAGLINNSKVTGCRNCPLSVCVTGINTVGTRSKANFY